MTLLSGQFAMIMLIEAPDELSAADLEGLTGDAAGRLGLSITVTEASGGNGGPERPRPYVISVYGADHPGIVYRISSALAEQAVNITDLVSRIAGGIYTVVLDVQLPAGLDLSELQSRLGDVAAELGMEVTIRPAEADLL